MNSFLRDISSLLLLTFTGMLAVTCGCSNSAVNEIEDLETVSLYSQTDQLAQTMQFIHSLDRYETQNFRAKVNSGLNRWASNTTEELAAAWSLPEATSGLNESIRQADVFTKLDDTTYFGNDADYVQQTYWYKKIAERIAPSNYVFHQEYLYQTARQKADQVTLDSWAEESDDLLFNALKLIHEDLVDGQEDEQVRQLTQAIKLFDWCIRNIHLVEARAWPTADTIKAEAFDLSAKTDAFPPTTGTAGPGYIRYPWQTLTYSKGDYLDRAQVFAGLCQQIDLPVAVLALPTKDDDSNRPYQEWLCGVVVGKELYLFDPLLGLPIHGKRPGSIATLAEVKANPELLSDLSLSVEESVEKMEYRVTADQLDDVIALVVAPPESLSRRMAGMESVLTGDARLKLTSNVDSLVETFKGIPGIKDAQLWHVPFSTALFREQVAIAESMSFDQEVASRYRWLAAQERPIDLFVQFRKARNCFLQGIFQSDKEKDIRSAVSLYYSFMYTDEEIELIERDEQRQRSLGILKDLNQSYVEWKSQLAFMKSSMGLIRADSAFYLSMCNYENNMPSTSLKWLTRVRNYDDDKRWTEYIKYHSGRALESMGDYQAAAKAYAADTSAQKHGSFLRKRWMERLTKDADPGS